MTEPLAPVHNPFGELIGIRPESVADGRSRYALDVGDDHHNPQGILHGGVVYSLADTGMGAALYSLLDRSEIGVTLEIKINYLRPVSTGTICCDTEVIHRGRRTALLESRVEHDGRLVAKASGTFFISKRET